ncbi:unnamed protein product [Prunus armeniaca]
MGNSTIFALYSSPCPSVDAGTKKPHIVQGVENFLHKHYQLPNRDAAYDLEDVIETYGLKVVSTKKRGVKNVLKRFACIFKEGVNLHRIGKETENITTKISELRSCLQKYNIKEINPCNWRTTRLSTTTDNAKVRTGKRRPFHFEIKPAVEICACVVDLLGRSGETSIEH